MNDPRDWGPSMGSGLSSAETDLQQAGLSLGRDNGWMSPQPGLEGSKQ